MARRTLEDILEAVDMSEELGISADPFIDDDESEFFIDDLMESGEPQSYGSNVVYIPGKNGGFSNKDEYQALMKQRHDARQKFINASKGPSEKKYNAAIDYIDTRIETLPAIIQIKKDRMEFRQMKAEELLQKMSEKEAPILMEERHILTDEERAKGRKVAEKNRFRTSKKLLTQLGKISELFQFSKGGMARKKGDKLTTKILQNKINYNEAQIKNYDLLEKLQLTDLKRARTKAEARLEQYLTKKEAKSNFYF